MENKMFAGVLGSIFLMFNMANADLLEIGDYGNTQEIKQVEINKKEEKLRQELEDPKYREAYIKEQTQKVVENSYKVSTPSLTPGQVKTKEVNFEFLYSPIAIVGCDKYSKKWLKIHRSDLIEYSPSIYVVNCKNAKDFKGLQQYSKTGLIPINGKALAEQYKLKHYPVLITKNMITQ